MKTLALPLSLHRPRTPTNEGGEGERQPDMNSILSPSLCGNCSPSSLPFRLSLSPLPIPPSIHPSNPQSSPLPACPVPTWTEHEEEAAIFWGRGRRREGQTRGFKKRERRGEGGMQFFILPPFLRSKHAFGTRLAFQSDRQTDRPSELKMRMEDGGQGPKE